MPPTSAQELRIEPVPPLPQPNKDWQRLGRASGNPFSTWEWASTWWRHFGDRRRQWLLGFRDAGGTVIGILPFYLASRSPLRILRLVGNGPADQLGPICAPEHRGEIAAALKRALRENSGWDICIAERMASTDRWPILLGGTVSRSEASPTIRFNTADWDEYLASKSSNFRHQVRRLERRLGREYTLRFRLAEDPDRLEQDMETFFALHEARWAPTGSTAFAGKLKRFHHEVAELAMAGGWLRLCFAELDGKPRAATYGFRLGNADWLYQVGRDPGFDKDRIGQVLLNHTVREAVCSGMSEFKLLLGDEAYKTRYTKDKTPVQSIVLGRGPAAQAAVAAAVSTRRLLRSIRERTRGHGARG